MPVPHRPGAIGRGRMIGHGPSVGALGTLDVEVDHEAVAVRRVARFGRLDPACMAIDDHPLLDEQGTASAHREET